MTQQAVKNGSGHSECGAKSVSLRRQHPNARLRTMWFSLLTGAVLSAAASLCSLSTAFGAPPPQAGAACCTTTSINANGVVTAKVNATGQQFQFTLSNSAQTRMLRAGQAVYANFTTKQVSLDGKTPAGVIISISNSGATANGTAQPTAGVIPQRSDVSTAAAGAPQLHPPRSFATKQVDPCSIPPADPADVLKALLNLGIKSYFPRAMQNGGEHIKLSAPEVEQVTCPNMTMKVKFAIEYRETRGFPQFQVSGSMEIESPMIGHVQYQPGGNGSMVITQSNFLQATAVLTDIQITALHLNHVPNWLDNTWIRACLNGQHSNWGCTDVVHQMSFDISNLVQVYLQQGHTL